MEKHTFMILDMKNIFVTGGSGFLGGHLLYKLVINGHSPLAIKRKNSQLKNVKNIFLMNQKIHLYKKIQWENCDLKNILKLEKKLEKIDTVFHCAGLVSFNKNDHDNIFETNYIGTKNLVNLCLKKSVNKFCHVSSIATLSNNETHQTLNEKNWFSFTKEKSNYAISKYLGEMEVWRGFSEGLNGFILNPSLIIGPGDTNSLFGKMTPKLKNGTLFYPNGGTGFVDVRDVANILIELEKVNLNHERYIINSENLSFKELLSLFSENTHSIKPKFIISNYLIGFFIIINKLLNPYNTLSLDMIHFFKSHTKYCNKKIINALNYKFIKIKKSIIDINSN